MQLLKFGYFSKSRISLELCNKLSRLFCTWLFCLSTYEVSVWTNVNFYNSDRRRQGCWKNVPFGEYASFIKLFKLAPEANWCNYSLSFLFTQVRVGTERGSAIVILTIVALYVLTFALGLSGTLPLPSIV